MKITKVRFFVLLILLLSFGNNVSAFEKVGTTSFQFLKVYSGARGSAMAGAFSAVAINSEALFWNPAGLANVKSFDASFGFVDWFMDVKHFSFSGGYNMGNFGTIGFLGVLSNVGDIEVTRVDQLGFINGIYNPGLTGEVISPSSLVLGVSYATFLTDKFAFGITAKYVNENLVYESAGALAFDAGLSFNTGFRSIVIGASIRHFGPEIKFIDKSYPLPQTFNIGISSLLISSDDPLLFNSTEHSLLVAYDMIQPRDYDQMHSMGVEYGFNDLIYLRGGYIFNGDQEGLSAGLGLKIQNYRLDYSFNDHGEHLEPVHRFTIGFEIN